MADLGAGRLYVRERARVHPGPRRGATIWVPNPPSCRTLARAELLDLVRAAGLHRVPDGPLREACVLVPGYLVPGVLERAVDLRLRASFQQARLDSLFDAAVPSRICYGVWLARRLTAGHAACRTAIGAAG